LNRGILTLSESSFAKKVHSRNHTITVEISPPKGTDYTVFLNHIRPMTGMVDAINVPDCQRSILKMSSMAAAKIIEDELGIETVWQLTCRDRNIIALQADLMGGWALGLRTVLALTGDPVQVGDQAEVAKQVSHLDALRLLQLIKSMNEGKDATGKELRKGGTQFCYGAALNPHRMSREAQLHRLQHKLSLGVQFFQTQPVYDMQTLLEVNELVKDICDREHYKPPKLMVGIIPPKSADFARFMNQKILGISIPQSFIDILDRSDNPVDESIRYCADLIEEMAPYAGGFHFMPVGMEKHSARMLETCIGNASGLKRLKAL
jgi:methylenetetrahydrofolate reductase (NADPH)